MRFSGEREMPAPVDEVWAALHDPEVLGAVVPGCTAIRPAGAGRYAATMQARVGRVTDTYQGTFTVADVRPGRELRVRVAARGRCGHVELDLYVTLAPGIPGGTTSLRYDAEATVGGLVSRLGCRALGVAGSHFTSGFFRDLDRRLRRGAARAVTTPG